MGIQAEMASGSRRPCPCERQAKKTSIVDLIIFKDTYTL